MPESEKSDVRLGRMELQIMNVVWKMGKATVHDVKDVLSKGRKPAYSTVLTMMRKLEIKGYLRHEVDDRTYVYLATISRRNVRHSLLGDLLDRLFEGSPALLLNNLIEQKRIGKKELDEIRNIIAKGGNPNE